jgi:succinoglycan biosynthesis protein ExoA
MPSRFVSVIVPVRNEERFLEATLRALQRQQYPADAFEVLVVDGQSHDGTVAVVRRLQHEIRNLRLLYNAKRLSSAARNIGVRHARGEFVVVVDGHCELQNRDYLRHLVEVFETRRVECVGRPQPLDVAGANLLQSAIAVARGSRLGHNPGSHIYSDEGGYVPPQSVAVAYRRGVFARVGYFDETFDACEDVEFNHRLAQCGMRCYLAPELTVRYHPRGSLAGLCYQMLRYGRGRARLLVKHPDTFAVAPLVPAIFLVTLAASFALGLVAPPFAGLFCLTVLAYCWTVIVAALSLGVRGRALRLTPILPIVFLSIHVGAGWGVLRELWPVLFRQLLTWLRPVLRRLRVAAPV